MIMPLQNMCHAKTFSIWREPQPDPPQTQLQAYVEYTKYQWVLYNDFKEVVQNGHYGAYYQFLIEELDMGPYWSDVKFYYGQVHEDDQKPVTPRRKLALKQDISPIIITTW